MATDIQFSQHGYRQLVNALKQALTPPSDNRDEQPATDTHTNAAYDVWTREAGPGQRDVLVAFLDDKNTLRWVSSHDLASVPKGWRPLLIGDSPTPPPAHGITVAL